MGEILNGAQGESMKLNYLLAVIVLYYSMSTLDKDLHS